MLNESSSYSTWHEIRNKIATIIFYSWMRDTLVSSMIKTGIWFTIRWFWRRFWRRRRRRWGRSPPGLLSPWIPPTATRGEASSDASGKERSGKSPGIENLDWFAAKIENIRMNYIRGEREDSITTFSKLNSDPSDLKTLEMKTHAYLIIVIQIQMSHKMKNSRCS